MKKLHGYIKIPVELCFYALTNRLFRPFQLYIYLACEYSGKVRIDLECKKEIANRLGLKTDRTISNNLKKLLGLRWITYSSRSGLYFIKGIDVIREEEGLKSVSAVEFLIKEIQYFRAFLGATIITFLINGQKKRERQSAERNKRYNKYNRSKKLTAQPSSYYSISCQIIADKLKMSPGTAQNLKLLAKNIGYVDIIENLTPTGWHVSNYPFYRKVNPKTRVRIKENQLFIQEADLVKSNMHFRSRKKIETLIRDTIRE